MQGLILFTHDAIGLPLPLFPLIFPSIRTRFMLFLRTRCPKNSNDRCCMVFIGCLFALALLNTSLFDTLSDHDIFNITVVLKIQSKDAKKSTVLDSLSEMQK